MIQNSNHLNIEKENVLSTNQMISLKLLTLPNIKSSLIMRLLLKLSWLNPWRFWSIISEIPQKVKFISPPVPKERKWTWNSNFTLWKRILPSRKKIQYMNVTKKTLQILKKKLKNLCNSRKQVKSLRKAPKRLNIAYKRKKNNQIMHIQRNIKSY